MKTKHLLLICFTFFIASLFSCQKDFTAPDNITARPDSAIVVGGDSNYLDRFVTIEGVVGSTIYDTSIFIFNYDTQKRITKVYAKGLYGNLIDSQEYVKFSYSLNDTLPYKARFTAIDTADYYFYYDNLGRLSKDSIVQYVLDTGSVYRIYQYVNNYSVSANYIFVSSLDKTTYPSGYVSIRNSKDTLNLDINGNVISSRYNFIAPSATYNNLFTASNFDNNLSPYTKAKAFKIFLFSFNDDFDGFSIGYPTTKNPVSITKTYSSGNVVVRNFTNSYFQNGFLKRYVMNSTNIYEDVKFYYKTL